MAQTIQMPNIKTEEKIQTVLGYLIVEKSIIQHFYSTLRSHATNLYDFRLVRDGKSIVLFYGTLVSENCDIPAMNIDRTAGSDLKKCVVKKDGNIQLIACSCANGDTVIGGWWNSQNDNDTSLQMLAYCMYAFAVLNTAYGPKDQTLKKKAIDSIPIDSRFAKYSNHTGETALIAAIYSTCSNKQDKNLAQFLS